MKILALTLAILSVSARTCGALGQTQELTDAHGAIVVVNERNGWYGIVPDDDRGTRYAPDRLPDEFKKDGLRVVFSGRVGQIDPNVRTWGTPLTVTRIGLEPTR